MAIGGRKFFRQLSSTCFLVVGASPRADFTLLPGLYVDGAPNPPFARAQLLLIAARRLRNGQCPLLARELPVRWSCPDRNIAFCGPTTAAIVLNAVRTGSHDLPRDHSRLHPEDLRYIPSGFDLTVLRFTQDNVISKGAKTRAQVLGEPVTVDGKQVADPGYQLRNSMNYWGRIVARLVVVDDKKSEEEIRADFAENLRRAGDYVVVNYRRENVALHACFGEFLVAIAASTYVRRALTPAIPDVRISAGELPEMAELRHIRERLNSTVPLSRASPRRNRFYS